MSHHHPLDGARLRLKRADENIKQLNRELTDFLSPAPVIDLPVDFAERKPIITDADRKAFEKLKEFLINGTVNSRFMVLTGEIIHHLRSSFDHLAWQLSSLDLQTRSPEQIEFPVFKERPITKDKIRRYSRKVEGISSPTALARIESLQPYHGTNPGRHPLWLIHDFDRIDKHRELVLAVYIMRMNLSSSAQVNSISDLMPWELKPRNVFLVGPATNMKMDVKMSAQVSFAELSKREDEPIIPVLQNLLRFTTDTIESFAKEFS